MRLFLLPISTRRALIYCQRLNNQLTSEQTYVEKITNRANTTWGKWEAAEKGWQKHVTRYGNQLFKRIPFEEWGLKSIPPLNTRKKSSELEGKQRVEVLYPLGFVKSTTVLDVLRRLATERQALHQKWMYGSIIGMPITIPLGLLPVVPNLPFFYLVFRAWSHWRALSGSKHLEFLVQNGLIKALPHNLLDTCYRLGRYQAHHDRLREEFHETYKDLTTKPITESTIAQETLEEAEQLRHEFEAVDKRLKDGVQQARKVLPRVTQSAKKTVTRDRNSEAQDSVLNLSSDRDTERNQLSERMLLSPGIGALIASTLHVQGLEIEIERAIQQTQKSIAARHELEEEKEELEKNVERDRKEVRSEARG